MVVECCFSVEKLMLIVNDEESQECIKMYNQALKELESD